MATKARHLKTAIQLWIADQRKAGGYTSADLARWANVTVDTARGWESRGRPSEDAIAVLERHFGQTAPREERGDEPGVTAALVASLTAQTDALNRLAAAIEQQPNASAVLSAIRALADVQADQSTHVQSNSERILTLEEAIAARFDEALAAERARRAPHGTTG